MTTPLASDDVAAADRRDPTAVVGGRESTAHLLRLFKVEPCTHRVVTRQDLIRDYDAIPSSGLSRDTDCGNEESVAINHYYTWNSSRTNAPIQKERAAIISALHSRSKSATALPSTTPFLSPRTRPLPPTKSFTRSHRVRDIVSMCSDGRCAFSADEYHNNETAETDAEDGRRCGGPPTDGYAHDAATDVGRCGSRCWSCTGTVGSDEYDSDGGDKRATAEADDGRKRTRRRRPKFWKRKLSRLLPPPFKKKRDGR